MKVRGLFVGFVLLIALLATLGGSTGAEGPPPRSGIGVQTVTVTAFTYQGQLKRSGMPVNGTCDFLFRLYDAASAGGQVGQTITPTIVITNGLFTTQLDFGDVFIHGEPCWLEVALRCPAGSGSYTTLSPRQALTAAPYAQYAISAGYANYAVYASYAESVDWSDLTNVPPGFADGVDNDTTYTAGAGLRLVGTTFSVDFAGPGSAETVARSDHHHDASYWRLGGNVGTTSTHFLGTSDNQALELRVNSARALRLEPNATSPSLIGGHSTNTVTVGVVGATISGGGSSGWPNRVTDDYGTVGGGRGNRAGDNAGTTSDYSDATVGGGYANTASGEYATVGGGFSNTASVWGATIGGGYRDTASGQYATVGGGFSNTASHYAATVGGGDRNTASNIYATVSGGWSNRASGSGAFVGGGYQNTASRSAATVGGGDRNTASGEGATVAGGGYNTAQGDYSFASGYRAKANHQGAFVWGDSADADIASTGNNEFIVRASGGIWLGTTSSPSIPSGRFINTSTGAYLSTGGVWTDGSSREYKQDIAPLTLEEALEALAGLDPVTFRYEAEGEERYVGFIAEDVPELVATADRKGLSPMDIVAVLTKVVQQQQKGLAERGAQIAELEARVAELEALVAKLAKGEKVGGGQ